MIVRRESPGDEAAVTGLHTAAFPASRGGGDPVEVTLLAALRRSDAWLPRLSLVATDGAAVVGHVVCSRAHIGDRLQPALGLGPIGVDPDHQARGVGSALIHAVLGAAEATDERLVALLGEPGFYGRFGFVDAAEGGVTAPDPAWGRYFQIRLLSRDTADLRGRFHYARPFADL